MLTPEQIKNLKKGDPIVINATFVRDAGDGDIHFRNQAVNGGYYDSYCDPSCVSLPFRFQTTPKYDPNRPYKKGDIVKRRTVDGRTDPDVPEGVHLTVTTSEEKYGNVRVLDPHGRSIVTKSVFLELVTPVEEMLPYHIQKAAEFDAWHICNRNNDVIVHFNPDPCNLRMDMAEIEKLAQDQCDYLNERFRDLIGKVIPVEELEPYELVETTDYWSVEKENKELCLFWKKYHHNAKEAAEAEAARLNTAWRKEQNNE